MDKLGEETIVMSRKRGLSMVATSGGRHGDQWQSLMRKFSQANKEKCKAVPTDMPQVVRGKKIFPTESTYEGSWNVLGMSGDGTYCFPYPGVKYEGEFDDGMFHGDGELKYANGIIVKGKWKKGQVTERKIVFGDGLEYSEHNWGYCKVPDRRFTIEYDNGLKPGGDTYVTNEQPPPEIPPGYYDVGDGFYEPITRTVYKYDDLTGIVRSPDLREQKWIIENCRTNPILPVGPASHLYEKWLQPEQEAEVPPPPAGYPKAAADEFQVVDMFYSMDADARKRSVARMSKNFQRMSIAPTGAIRFRPGTNKEPSEESLFYKPGGGSLDSTTSSQTSRHSVRMSIVSKDSLDRTPTGSRASVRISIAPDRMQLPEVVKPVVQPEPRLFE